MSTAFEFDPSSVEFEETEQTPEKTRKPRSDKGVPRGPRGTSSGRSTDKKLTEQLLEPFVDATNLLAPIAPTAAQVMALRAERTITSVVTLTANMPKVRAALVKGAKISHAVELGLTLAMILLAFGLDFGRVDPHSLLPMSIKHTEKDSNGNKTVVTLFDLYVNAHPEVVQQDATTDGFRYEPPPGFTNARVQGFPT